jgi:hypothetical protein
MSINRNLFIMSLFWIAILQQVSSRKHLNSRHLVPGEEFFTRLTRTIFGGSATEKLNHLQSDPAEIQQQGFPQSRELKRKISGGFQVEAMWRRLSRQPKS